MLRLPNEFLRLGYTFHPLRKQQSFSMFAFAIIGLIGAPAIMTLFYIALPSVIDEWLR
jgi:hypothetical protein